MRIHPTDTQKTHGAKFKEHEPEQQQWKILSFVSKCCKQYPRALASPSSLVITFALV